MLIFWCTLESRIAGEGWQLIGSWFCISTLLLEQYPLIKKSPKKIAFCLEALFSLNIHLEMSKSSLCFYLMLQQTCCMHSLASKLGCYVSIHMHKYQEFIQVNLRISKVPSYWRWSPLLKSGSFSDEPPYSRTPLIQDSRVWIKWWEKNIVTEKLLSLWMEKDFLLIYPEN